jgi:hypothetical protein
MASLNRFFSGLKSAGVSGRGNYFPYANALYRCEISRFFFKDDRKAVFVAEIDVIETVKYASSDPNKLAPTPGERRSWIVDTTKELNMALRDLNGFLLPVMGVDVSNKLLAERALDETEAFAEYAISANNPLGGAKVNLETFEIKTKAKGNDFTVHNWLPSPESIGFEAWIAKMRGGAAPAKAPAPHAISAPGPALAPVQHGGKWFLPQPDGSLRPL